MKRALFAAAIAAVGSASAAQPQPASPPSAEAARSLGSIPLGRLFFTPAERAQLDVARVKKPAPSQPTADVAAAPATPLPQIVTYGGIIRRSDGKAMLWLNNRLVEEKEALAGLNLKGRVRPDGAVTLQVPDSGTSIDVKVGQSVEIHTGKVAEGKREPPDAKSRADEKSEAKGEAKSAEAPAAASPEAAAAAKPASK